MDQVFEEGKLNVKPVKASESSSPPKPLLIITPTVGGEYPVVVFFHGFCLSNNCYSAILGHVASHGYIAVAPQLYSDNILYNAFFPPNDEIESAYAVLDWLSQGLQSSLPNDVQANMDKLAIAGHSRGGRAAFSIALDRNQTSFKISLLMGIDPVAGKREGEQLEPKILNKVPRSFNMGGIPVLVVGTGFGEQFPAFAPKGLNHKEFYNECQAPRFHLVAMEYGHVDMLGDDLPIEWFMHLVCKSGKDRESMRKFVGGTMVAFLKAYFEGDSSYLNAILDHPSIAPVKLEVDYDKEYHPSIAPVELNPVDYDKE